MRLGKNRHLTAEQRHRFSRQAMLPEIGEEGQKRLGRSKVLLVGLGGLGSISSLYLAAAGVGSLRIVDSDGVRIENLNRQILHSTEDLGRPKVESASEKLLRLNPGCCVQAATVHVEDENASGLAKGCSLIIDGTDNIRTRRILNRVSLEKGIPFLYGGIQGWNGMASTFIPGKTGCFNCLFPREDTAVQETPWPALGPTAGMIASIQSMEAMLILLGLPSQLAGKLLTFRGREMGFRSIALPKDPGCPLCGQPGTG